MTTIDAADPYELPNNDYEWMKEIDGTRDTDKTLLSTTSKGSKGTEYSNTEL